MEECMKKKSYPGSLCSAVNCSNSKKTCPTKAFFRFPKEPERCKKWVMNCKRADLNGRTPEYLYKNCRICSDHFEDDMFFDEMKNRLRRSATPTLFNSTNISPKIYRIRLENSQEFCVVRSRKRQTVLDDMKNSIHIEDPNPSIAGENAEKLFHPGSKKSAAIHHYFKASKKDKAIQCILAESKKDKAVQHVLKELRNNKGVQYVLKVSKNDKAVQCVLKDQWHPLSVKEHNATGTVRKVRSKGSLGESDLCSFHSKFLKSLTALDADDNEIQFCMRCGLPIKEKKWLSATVLHIVCKIGHSTTFSAEFAQGCREWVSNCHKLDRGKLVSAPAIACHLCCGHFANLCTGNQVAKIVEAASHGDPKAGPESVTQSSASMETAPLISPNSLVLMHDYAVPQTRDQAEVHIRCSTTSDTEAAPLPSLPHAYFMHGYAATPKKTETQTQVPFSGDSTAVTALLPSLPSSFLVHGFCAPSRRKQTSTKKTQTKCSFIRSSSSVKIDVKKYRLLWRQHYRLKKKMVAQEERLKTPPKVDLKLLSKALPQYLSGPFLRLVQEQLKARSVQLHGMRWSEDVIALAQVIRAESPTAYAILRRLLPLPARSVLRLHPKPIGGLPSLDLFLRNTYVPDLAQPVQATGDGSVAEAPPPAISVVEEPIQMEEGDFDADPQEVIEAPFRLVAVSDDMHIYEVLTDVAVTVPASDAMHFEEVARAIGSNVNLMRIEEQTCATAFTAEDTEVMCVDEVECTSAENVHGEEATCPVKIRADIVDVMYVQEEI